MPPFDGTPDYLSDEEQPENRRVVMVETAPQKHKEKSTDERFERWRKFTESDPDKSSGTDHLIVYRMLNQRGRAEGPNVAPEVIRGIRVLPPTEFRIVYQEEGKYCTRFILAWVENPAMTLWQPQYAIYTFANQTAVRWHGQNLNSTIWQGPLQDPVLTVSSPCEVIVWGYQRQPVTFAIQTRLSNGLISSTDAMPTCAAQCDPYWSRVRTVTASYSCTIDDEVILADATSGAITITLFDLRQLPIGRKYTVKKIDTSANAVTVQGFNSQQIDNAASYVNSTAYQSNDFENDRANGKWWVI